MHRNLQGRISEDDVRPTQSRVSFISIIKETRSFWEALRPIKPEVYLNMTLAKLAVVGIFLLGKEGLEPSFDNTVVILYRLFPEKFKLVSFPEYPDFIRVDNTLRLDCRRAHYIIGNRVKGFQLTAHGETLAQDALTSMHQGKMPNEKATVGKFARNRATKLVRSVLESEAYRKFRAEKRDEIQQYDMVDMLHGTPDTDQQILKNNLDQLRFYAEKLASLEEYHQQASDVLNFLSYIESRLDDV